MDKGIPFFSIILATHLRPQLLGRALASLHKQSFQAFEILVVTDALEAESAAVCAQMLRAQDMFIKRAGPPGPAESRNLGLAMARGQWVVFLDDDDTFREEHLAVAREAILRSGSAVLFSDYQLIVERREPGRVTPLSETRIQLHDRPVDSVYVKNFIPNNALVFEARILKGSKVTNRLESLEDWDFLLSVCEKALPRYYPGGGAVVHQNADSAGSDQRSAKPSANDLHVLLDYLQVYRSWPAPTPELRARRQEQIAAAGLNLPEALF